MPATRRQTRAPSWRLELRALVRRVVAAGLLFGLTALVLFVALLALVARHPVDKGDVAPREFTVPAGAPLQLVARRLERSELIHSAFALRAWALWARPPLPKAGRHLVSASMDLRAMLEALAKTPLSDDAPLTVLEGWRLRDVDEWLSDASLIKRGAYERAAREMQRHKLAFAAPAGGLEGYLYPETYRVPTGPVNVDALIQRQLDVFTERFVRPYSDEISRSGRTLHELVVVASLLEKEEPNAERRPEVAGIIYNRLDAKVPLGIDATSRYSLADWTDGPAFLRALRNPDDTYNTRLRPGLPPTPIGAASLASLVAALRPAKTPYWYYLHDREGRIHFGRDAKEHEDNRRKYNVY